MKETKIETTLCAYCGAYHWGELGEPPFSPENGTYIVEGFDEPVCEDCVLKYKRLMGIRY